MSNHSESHEHLEHTSPPEGTKAIWRTFFILLVITIADFGFYFTLDPSMGRNILFIGLAIVKAYYIVGIFMHMSYEKAGLRYSILIPVLFIIALILACLLEGTFWSMD
jgi:cytochrome c oxidase subunit 4